MARPIGTKKEGIKYLDESQLSRLFQAVKRAKNFQHELWFDLTLYFGLRVTELTHLKLSDIKGDIKGIEVKGVKNGLTMLYRRIDARLWHKIQRWLRQRSTQNGNPYLFPSVKFYSEPTTEQAVKNAFKKYCQRAGLNDGFSIHSLRHSCGMLKAKRGDSPIDIKDWLRQRSLDSTLVYLQRISFERQSERASETFGRFL